ncbi:methylated-DNA--[protein]-cysteine S-methyltransferase [Castellaniella sp.]|uniref:methylated-DNA--[protein]-cysteine S-methyltransferase n=1 Tax=Castellaniella sp. TaxID=1955812 RepID=UPI0035691CFF
MSYYALIASPLGPILLQAEEGTLAGLYFADQADCPHIPGLDPVSSARARGPALGQRNGQPLHSFRVAGQADQGGPPDTSARAGGAVPASRPAIRYIGAGGEPPARVRQLFAQVEQQLGEYWEGRRRHFDLPLAAHGTGFQKKVWDALLAVPFGSTLSYGELAGRAGFSARHGRAVGAAVGRNPISIIIPCHRILAKDHTLNGYGGGLDRKLRLLQLEGLSVRAPA